jgi:hypothetical protein
MILDIILLNIFFMILVIIFIYAYASNHRYSDDRLLMRCEQKYYKDTGKTAKILSYKKTDDGKIVIKFTNQVTKTYKISNILN